MEPEPESRWARLRHEWGERLQPGEQATVLAWLSFTLTFAGLRGLTHWIRAGHGPSGGGMKLGGKHFHHYNIGIGMLATVGGVGLRGTDKQRRHPAAPLGEAAAQHPQHPRLPRAADRAHPRGRRSGQGGETELVRPPSELQALAFTGIHVISPRLLGMMSEEGAFSIINTYLRLAGAGENILGFRADEYYWRDLGKAEQIQQAAEDFKKRVFS